MRKIFLAAFVLFLTACSSPQVTVTSQVTVTLPPPTAAIIPTPTLHPQFVELQDKVAASGERFTLLPDGIMWWDCRECADKGLKLPGDYLFGMIDKQGGIIINP